MNKVTPKAGQVWDVNGLELKIRYVNIETNVVRFTGGSLYSLTHVRGGFTFIPQNDLEWLAVNCDRWHKINDDIYIIRNNTINGGYAFNVIGINSGSYTRQEWQNMRYDLGLDEPKNKITWADCPFPTITINCPCTTAPLPEVPEHMYCRCSTKLPLELKKDTKMIDLSPFKIGDKLITRDNDRVKVVFLSESQMITEDEDGSGCLNMYKLDGTCIDRNAAGNFCSISDIVSRYDPRHWLSQLPDAGLFRGYWLACSDSCNNSEWHVWDEEPSEGLTSWVKKPCGNIFCERVTAIKMPKLTGDEWKLSKISIVDLAAWQVANPQ